MITKIVNFRKIYMKKAIVSLYYSKAIQNIVIITLRDGNTFSDNT
jgi:hypothetical protein